MNETPLITTIIPTCNRPHFFKRALESVLGQSVANFQVCVYDNSSDDQTQIIAREAAKKDSRVKYHRHPQNIGAVANFDYGLSEVNTQYFSFLSDDDVLLPKFYEITLDGFARYPEAGFVCGTVILSDPHGRIINVTTNSWKDKEYYEPSEGLFEMIPKHLDWMGILFKKQVRDVIGGIDTKVKAIDLDYILRASACFAFVVSKQPCAVFFQHSKSYSYYAGLKVIWPGYLNIQDNLLQSGFLSSEDCLKLQSSLKIEMQRKLIFMFVHSLKRKDLADALLSVNVLKTHFQRPVLSLIFELIVWSFQYCQFFYPVLYALLKMRNQIIRRKRSLQYRYGEYVQSISGINE